jgi:hypothetical protein
MTTPLPELARRWSRAVERGRGIRIEADDLDLLTAIGVTELIQAGAAEKLKERARWREGQRSEASTPAETTGSTETSDATAPPAVRTTPFSGMTQKADASDLLAHAQQICRPRGRR